MMANGRKGCKGCEMILTRSVSEGLFGTASTQEAPRLRVGLVLLFAVGAAAATAAEPRVMRDVEYARVGNISLKLDLYVPSDAKAAPLIVWVHGGAWRSGSKANPSVLPLTDRGFAIASVDYRLSPV